MAICKPLHSVVLASAHLGSERVSRQEDGTSPGPSVPFSNLGFIMTRQPFPWSQSLHDLTPAWVTHRLLCWDSHGCMWQVPFWEDPWVPLSFFPSRTSQESTLLMTFYSNADHFIQIEMQFFGNQSLRLHNDGKVDGNQTSPSVLYWP